MDKAQLFDKWCMDPVVFNTSYLQPTIDKVELDKIIEAKQQEFYRDLKGVFDGEGLGVVGEVRVA